MVDDSARRRPGRSLWSGMEATGEAEPAGSMPEGLRRQPFVVVDLETTGPSALLDRVIEVAALRLQDGRVVDRFETLVDPGVHIPAFITGLTGIDDSMVRGKPRVQDVAAELYSFLAGAVFVAHNAGFDHGFLKQEFRRVGMSFEGDRLCTVRLSRRVFPGLRSYSLDSLISHLGVECADRHRAGGDAEVTCELLLRMLFELSGFGVDDLEELLRFQDTPTRKCAEFRAGEQLVSGLPSCTGVYMLKDAEGHVLYIGKSTNIRRRIREHFRAESNGQRRLRRLLRYVKQVDHIETGSELEALLLESRLIKHCLPEGNRQQRDYESYPFIRVNVKEKFPRIEYTREPEDDDVRYFGPFTQPSLVTAAVSAIQDEFGLRTCSRRFRQTEGSCARRDMGRCLAPCSGEIGREEYMARVEEAMSLLAGHGASYLEGMEERMILLAEDLRFEEAAALRDRIASLRALVQAQEKLNAAGCYDLVAISPATRPGWRELFFIRQGRLALQMACPEDVERERLRRLLTRIYFSQDRTMAISKSEVDEMHIIADWLRRGGRSLHKVPIRPDSEGLEQALDQVMSKIQA